MANILVVYAHPNYNSSRMNQALIGEIQDENQIVISNLYEKYPNRKIDALEEQSLILASDLIVLQFPFYWFNTTPLMKAWFDEVLLDGFAYGVGGDKLVGKKIMCCITIGSSEERYSNDLGFTLTDLLKPFEATARYCGMKYQSPFVVPNYNTDTKTTGISDKNLFDYAHKYKRFLTNYTSGNANSSSNTDFTN